MAVSKKVRFEVFKRDGFRCAYCGKTPPSVVLEVDHIDPKSKGGKDDINNLITACFDCNRGKKDIPLSTITNQMADNLEALKEKEKQYAEYQKFIKKINKRIESDIDEINSVYTEYFPGYEFSDNFKNVSIKRFLTYLSKEKIIEAIHIAVSRFPNTKYRDKVISYFCGVCWKMIKGGER